MSLEEALKALDNLVGVDVQAEIWTHGEDGDPVVFLEGELRRMPHLAPSEQFREIEEAAGDTAEIFFVGNAQVNVWPRRFVGARVMPHDDGWLELHTPNTILRIGPRRIPWL